MNTDTIAARATAPGAAAVAVIRVSGSRARDVLGRVFRTGLPGADLAPRRLVRGLVVDASGRPQDEVLAVWMPGPRSFTGEDSFEIQGHGGPAVSRAVLQAVLDAGARLAEPGEFTRRAFLNGKLDLTQAEAVAELASAACTGAAGLALDMLRGNVGRTAARLRQRLEDLRAQICLAVDFPEEDDEFVGSAGFASGVVQAIDEIVKLITAYERSRPLRQGALAVLAGPVNAGKSSLLNALLGRERALVSDEPGTTRDYLEESLDLDGLAVRLADTAGLRQGGGQIEQRGMDLSIELVDKADLVLLVVDVSAEYGPNRQAAIAQAAARRGPDKTLVVANKADLNPGLPQSDALAGLAAAGVEVVPVSAKTGQGLDELAARMRARILGPDQPHGLESGPDAATPNLRQAQALTQAKAELDALLADQADGVTPDCLGVRLETACDRLREITGELSPQHVLDNIFARFCIGK